MKKKTLMIFSWIFCLLIGVAGGFYGLTALTIPNTDDVHDDIYYYDSPTDNVDFSGYEHDISIHFIELGNKYSGDCTYIKTPQADILIDCGSKSSSIPVVANYLNDYVTDGILEYVIVTHAHQDHYAGFATSTKVDSIFDLFECQNIIYFSNTNQTTGATYKNFLRELGDEVANGAKAVTALDCINETNGAKKSYEIGENASLTILNSHYYTNSSTTENDYSVCCLISSSGKNFLFTGDLEENGESYLVDLNDDILPEKVDLYKAGHHGSKTSSSQKLMARVQPKVVCVCCCAGSSEYTKTPENQFPTQKFIDNVAPYTDEIYVTTLCVDYKADKFTSFNGNIVYACNSTSYKVFCSNNTTKLKDSEWFKNNRIWRT